MITEQWALGKITHYRNIMGCDPPNKIFLHQDDFIKHGNISEKWVRQLKEGNGMKRLAGMNVGVGEEVYVDIDNGNRRSVENTIVHEIMHTKYPDMKHGMRYSSAAYQIAHGNYPPKKVNIIKALYHWYVEGL